MSAITGASGDRCADGGVITARDLRGDSLTRLIVDPGEAVAPGEALHLVLCCPRLGGSRPVRLLHRSFSSAVRSTRPEEEEGGGTRTMLLGRDEALVQVRATGVRDGTFARRPRSF